MNLPDHPLQMNRRLVFFAACAAALPGCSSTGPDSNDAAAKRRMIDGGVDDALSLLYATAAGARELASRSQGILVFPRIATAGFVIGGTYGEGALRKAGTTSAYYSVASASVGLLAGAQSRSLFLFFMTPQALQQLETGDGWTAGAGASVTFVDAGAEGRARLDTAQGPVIGFAREPQGFMAGVSIDGTKFSKMKL